MDINIILLLMKQHTMYVYSTVIYVRYSYIHVDNRGIQQV